MNIGPVGAELFDAEGRTGGHDETNSRFSQIRKAPKNMFE